MSFPKARAVSSYNFVTVHPPMKRSLLPNSTIVPLSDFRVKLAKLVKYKPKVNAVKVDTQIYSKEQLCTISKVHKLLEVKKKVEEEVIWINNYSCTVALECNKVAWFCDGFNDTCVSKAFPSLLTCDICLLTCNRWFTSSTIQVISELLNKAVTNVKFILFSTIQYIS